MNPFQLLAVGQSLIKGRNTPSPYKMDEQHLLPKFAKVGRPISLAPPPKPVAVPKDLFRAARAESAGVVPAPVVAAPVLAKTVLAPASPLGTSTKVPVFAVKLSEPKPKKPRKKLFGFGPKTTPEGRLVQAELSLNAVKVVCNDLSDSDFEIVTRRTAPAVVPAVAPVPLPEPEARMTVAETGSAAVSIWKRWCSRLVGAVRTIF